MQGQRGLVKVCIVMIYSWQITFKLRVDCISETVNGKDLHMKDFIPSVFAAVSLHILFC